MNKKEDKKLRCKIADRIAIAALKQFKKDMKHWIANATNGQEMYDSILYSSAGYAALTRIADNLYTFGWGQASEHTCALDSSVRDSLPQSFLNELDKRELPY